MFLLEQMVGSIKGFFYKRNPVDVYNNELPFEVKTPFMYFQKPRVSDRAFTKQSFSNMYICRIRLFEDDSEKAFLKAHEITQEIRENGFYIPLLNEEDGSPTGKSFYLDDIEVETIDEEIIQVTITWDSNYKYIRGNNE